MPPPSPAAADPTDLWRDRLAALRADPAQVVQLRDLAVARESASQAVAELVRAYLAKKIGLAELRTVFDKKTRKEWASLGAAGPSGAMVVNQIAAQSTQELSKNRVAGG